MPSDPFLDPVIVVKLVKSARADALPFAFGFGPNAEPVLAVDRRRAGKQMAAVIRKDRRIATTAHGTLTSDGKTVTFACDKQPSGLAKLLTQWLRANGLNLKAAIVDLGSEVVQDESEVEEHPGGRSSEPEGKVEDDEAEDEEDGAEDEGPDRLFAAETVTRRLTRARKQAVAFAFVRGASPEDDRLALHLRKEPAELAKLARQETRASKFAYGRVSVASTLATFTTEKPPSSWLRKSIRGLFKLWGLSIKVAVVGPDGAAPPEGDDEAREGEGGQVEDELTVAAGETRARCAELARRLSRSLATLAELGWSSQEADRFQAAMQRAKALWAAADGDFAPCLEELEQAAQLHDTAVAAAPKRTKGLAALAKMNTVIDQLQTERGAELRVLAERTRQALLSMADLQIGSALFTELRDGIKAAQDAATLNEADPESLRADLSAARDAFSTAIADVDGQIKTLQSALRASEDEDLHTIADYGVNAVTGNFRVPLMAALMDLDRVDAARRPQAAAKAMAAAERFLRHVEDDQRVAACDNNPFDVPVTIRQTLGAGLRELRKALAVAS